MPAPQPAARRHRPPDQQRRVRRMEPVEDLDSVPEFASEAEEAAFWATHSLGEGVLSQMGPPPPGLLPPPRPRPIAVRLDAEVLRRLKALAAKRHKGYQALLKEFVVERLDEEERREGLLLGERDEQRPVAPPIA